MIWLSPGGKTTYLPILDQGPPIPRWVAFADWWNAAVLRDANVGHTVTRKELVLILSNKEGGRHFDEELKDPAYITISSEDFGWKLVTPEGEKPIIRARTSQRCGKLHLKSKNLSNARR